MMIEMSYIELAALLAVALGASLACWELGKWAGRNRDW